MREKLFSSYSLFLHSLASSLTYLLCLSLYLSISPFYVTKKVQENRVGVLYNYKLRDSYCRIWTMEDYYELFFPFPVVVFFTRILDFVWLKINALPALGVRASRVRQCLIWIWSKTTKIILCMGVASPFVRHSLINFFCLSIKKKCMYKNKPLLLNKWSRWIQWALFRFQICVKLHVITS